MSKQELRVDGSSDCAIHRAWRWRRVDFRSYSESQLMDSRRITRLAPGATESDRGGDYDFTRFARIDMIRRKLCGVHGPMVYGALSGRIDVGIRTFWRPTALDSRPGGYSVLSGGEKYVLLHRLQGGFPRRMGDFYYILFGSIG